MNILLRKKHSTWKGPGVGEGLADCGERKRPLCLGQGEQGEVVGMWGLWIIAEAVRESHFDNDCNSENYKRALKVALLPSQALSPIRTHLGLQPRAQPAAHCAQGLSSQRLMICPLRMLLTFVKHLSQGTNSPR